MKGSRVFISYNNQDYSKASIIKERLESVGLEVSIEEIETSNDIINDINYKISSSDYFIILLSEHYVESKWTEFEMNKIRSDFYYRNIVIIPVLISKVKKPYSLRNFKSFKLYEDFDNNLEYLSSYLKNIKYLDFDLISEYEFMNLVSELLVKLKFKIDNKEIRQLDYGVDIIASSINRNQLVDSFTTNWLIDCRFYKSSRVDLSSIKELSYQIRTNYPNYNGVLVTNSLITSTTLETLEIIRKKDKVNIFVVDGRKLKQLLLKYPELIEKFFFGIGGF
ncbi:TIR domain-containing protein [Ornithinibacillus californiensis]|uniref:TIR domain-containing protein n=1 Tax=Ornithinibacillus californiensis TaxID=161536 RepID=UPI00064D8840|nr:TIR domain-containing protein [Ornithinibacillus californiensis]